LQRFADETGLAVTVSSAARQQQVEPDRHRLFAYICQNWRGKRARVDRARVLERRPSGLPRQLLAGRV